MARNSSEGRNFTVIQGGAPAARTPVTQDGKGNVDGVKLAGDLALLYHLGLVSRCPVSLLNDPHTMLRFGAGEPFALNELLCELRNLPWFDRVGFHMPEKANCDAGRNCYWNEAGQLTRRTVYNAGIRSHSATLWLSRYWAFDFEANATLADCAVRLNQMPLSEVMSGPLSYLLERRRDDMAAALATLSLTHHDLKKIVDDAAKRAMGVAQSHKKRKTTSQSPSAIAAKSQWLCLVKHGGMACSTKTCIRWPQRICRNMRPASCPG